MAPSVIDRYDQWLEQNTGVGVALGLILLVAGGFLVTTTISIPDTGVSDAFSQVTGAKATVDLDKQTGIPFLKTVGTGVDEVEFTATVTNTGSISDEFQIRAAVISDDGNSPSSSYRINIEDGGADSASGPGTNAGPVTTSFTTLEPGESFTRSITVSLSDVVDGDQFTVASQVRTPSGEVDGANDQEQINVQQGDASLALTAAGVVMSFLGILTMGMALA